jgi:hypothetical protein
MRKALLVPLLALAAAGCGGGAQYIYRPVAPSGYVASGPAAARYVLPASNPTGEVRLFAEGIETITNRATEITYHTLHVRMTVTNRSDTAPWLVDPRAQLADLPARGWTAPLVAAIRRHTISWPVEVAPGAQRTLDLYYPLPAQAPKAERIPDFTLAWQVAVPGNLVAEQTTFARLRAPMHTTTDEGYLLGEGYYDPLWQNDVPMQPLAPLPGW